MGADAGRTADPVSGVALAESQIARLAKAMYMLYQRGWSIRTTRDGRVWYDAAQGDAQAPEAIAALEVIQESGNLTAALARWPATSWESAARYGTADALLYPLIGSPVTIAEGVVTLHRVIDGWAQVVDGAGSRQKIRAWRVLPNV